MNRICFVSCLLSKWVLLAIATVLTPTIQGHAVLEFSVEPSDTVVEAEQSAVLDCVVKASHHQQSVLIQWLDQDGSKLTFLSDLYRSQLTNGSLYINRVIEEERLTGTYQCMATLPNVGSIVSRTAKLSIARLSGFFEEPRDITVYLDQRAHFTCYVDAFPPPRIRWLKDERPLQIDNLRMTVLPSGALEIDEVVDSDQGSYRCNASGPNSYKLSNKAHLYINEDQEQAAHRAAPTYIAQPRPDTVIEGQNISLDCAANGNPNPTITWLKDGYAIDMNDLDSRFSLVGSTSSLRITKIQEQDRGTYQCRAENREDSLDASALIEIQVPPRFLKKPHDRTEYSTKDIELECSVYGIPEPKIQWFKNGELVKYSEYYKLVNGNNLKIMGLVDTDSGIFQCFASNPAGNIQAAASLKVLTNTVEKKKPLKPRSKKGQPKPLDSPYKKHSISSFTALKSEDGGVLGDVDFGRLQKTIQRQSNEYDPQSAFSSLKSSESSDDLGDIRSAFSPQHSSVAGNSERKITDGLPGPPLDLKSIITKARFVILSWTPPVENANHVEAYYIYYRQEGSERERIQNTTRSKLEEISIGGLSPGTVYHFRVVPISANGAGVSSNSLTLTTLSEEHVPSAPQNFGAYSITPRSIHVSWTPPETTNGKILRYTVYYMETTSSVEHNVDTTELSTELNGLNPYTEYSVWVVAANQNGAGAATEEKLVRTFSAPPSEPPSNITIEPSSTSIVVRWEPPPVESQNGVILGYKIKYRKSNKGKGTTYTTPANERHYVIADLERGAPYQIRVWAMNVNGTGPASDWVDVETFQNDVDENTIPGQPSGLKFKATSDKLYLMWAPPINQNVRVRSYIIGWGKGVDDDFRYEIDERNRTYIIEGLVPNSEYIITVRASNKMGPGPPVYGTARTQNEPAPEPAAALMPPIGLKAHVLSTTSVVLYWIDPTLKQSQYIRDNRYYKVKYTADMSVKSKVINATDLNTMINDLKPNTLYEFAVKLVKGRRESSWSMVVHNRTWELPPNVAPRDVDVHLKSEESQLVELTWLPPKTSNGRITGYVILYTDNKTRTEADWQALAIKGDNHSSIIYDLKPFTVYYFKVQARNSRGYGPFSNIVSFRTGQNVARHAPVQGNTETRGVFSSSALLYATIGGCLVAVATVALVVGFLCCRKTETNLASPNRDKKGYQKGNQGVKPPDLWIHHDQMELKTIEKRHSNHDGASSSGALTLPRSVTGNEYETHDSIHSNSLDKRSYAASYGEDKLKKPIRTKITLPVDSKPPREPIATPVNTTSLNQSSSDSTPPSRPNYPRTTYQVPRTHVQTEAPPNATTVENVYSAHPGSSTFEGGSSNASTYLSQAPPGSTYAPGMNVLADAQAGKRVQAQGHPLKSFTVPAPPPGYIVRPMSSPYKKPNTSSSSTPTSTPPSRISAANPPPHTAEEVQRLQPSHSTEELNQEMANLEGLMLTLNAITANEFEC